MIGFLSRRLEPDVGQGLYCVDEKMLVPGIRSQCTIYSCWVLPELRLNKEFLRFHCRPVGDSAELMPLDTALNKDVHECAWRHVVVSWSGAVHGCRDALLFSFVTPKEVARTYRRVFDPVDGVAPKPKRIVQNAKRTISTVATIAEHQGVFVPGLAGGCVAGRRHVRTTAKTSKHHGGKREKKKWGDNFPIHKDQDPYWMIRSRTSPDNLPCRTSRMISIRRNTSTSRQARH